MSVFRFQQFSIEQSNAPFKVGTDSVLLGSWAAFSGDETVLDVGTGTGILALMAAQKLPNGTVLATEPNADAFYIAEQNFKASPFSSRIIPLNEPLQSIQPDKKLDAIITNPPYFVDSTLNKEMGKTMARHTASLSFEEIVEFAVSYLDSQGILYIVLPTKEFKDFHSIAAQNKIFLQRRLDISSFEDSGVKRNCGAFGFSEQSEVMVEKLAIRERVSQAYSEQYKELTAEFHTHY